MSLWWSGLKIVLFPSSTFLKTLESNHDTWFLSRTHFLYVSTLYRSFLFFTHIDIVFHTIFWFNNLNHNLSSFYPFPIFISLAKHHWTSLYIFYPQISSLFWSAYVSHFFLTSSIIGFHVNFFLWLTLSGIPRYLKRNFNKS